MDKIDIRSLDSKTLHKQLEELNVARYRAKQIEEWIWKHGVTHFDEMTNLSKSFRELLKEKYCFKPIIEHTRQTSSDGTIKVGYLLDGGHMIESVLIPVQEKNRYTVCVSSQAGCSLSCTFCATGKLGLLRQLESAEIVDQVRKINMLCEATYGHHITNIVFMGMGEPLLNYKKVMYAIERISSEQGLHISQKRITVSTAGIAKMIRKCADDGAKFNLALSLHAANDEKRNTIMAINETNNLAALMESITYFYEVTGNRISYEYIALKDFNLTQDDVKGLIKLCRQFPVRINIIEYNPIQDGVFDRAHASHVDNFAKQLVEAKIRATVRKSRGQDIDAACGQLANNN